MRKDEEIRGRIIERKGINSSATIYCDNENMESSRTNAKINLFPINLSTNQTSLLSKSDSSDTIASSQRKGMILYPHDCVFGFDYIEHIVLPENTLQGICIQYKVSPVILRQINKFSGSTLLLAPKRLIIPLKRSGNTLSRSGGIMLQDQATNQYKIHKMLAECPNLKENEARTYLHLNNWNLIEGVVVAREDINRKNSYEKQKYLLAAKSLSSCKRQFRCKAIEEEKSDDSSGKTIELKIIKKGEGNFFTNQLENNNYDFDKCTVNYILKAVPRNRNTAGIMNHQAQENIRNKGLCKQSNDEWIDFGIELKDLSS